ncbi:hypothetical protein [Micromonospora sp. CA-248212]|uniref:hypothetical protein n=1 Tax=Micromonospora sp. CA-248212 TaxID=3239961 RepID=UPI003D92068A
MPADLIVYALLLGGLLIAAAVLFTNPAPLLARVRAIGTATHVDLLGLPPGRPLHEREDYPGGRDGAYVIHSEMRAWSGLVAELADLAEVAPLIEAAYLPVGASR